MSEKSLKTHIAFAVFGLASLAALFVVARQQRARRAAPKAAPPAVRKLAGKESHFACSYETMGTEATIVVVAPEHKTAEKYVRLAMAQIEVVNKTMNTYRPESELSRVNRDAASGPVEVSPELFTVIAYGVHLSQLSGGAFDVTYSPLRDLWRQAQKNNRLPTQAELDACRKKVGWQKLKLDKEKHTVQFEVPGMKIDLGGIAKGYGIDTAAEVMTGAGLKNGFVDIGGDLRVLGRTESGRKWTIGVRDPRYPVRVAPDLKHVPFLGKLNLTDCGVATSGDYERYFVVDGKHYSHIINPATGWPVDDVVSVTVIAPTAIEADGLATVVSILSVDKSLKLIESIDGVECMLVAHGPKGLVVRQSSGFIKFFEGVPE